MAEAQPTLGFLLHDSARLLRRNFERRAHETGITRAQWSVLANLQRQEGLNQVQLADILDIEPITLARLLDRLESAGWVERRADPNDRRMRRLYLTDTARPLMSQFRRLADESIGVALAGFSDGERAQLLDLLLRVRTNLSPR